MSEIKAWSPIWGLGTLDYKPERVVFTPDSGAGAVSFAWTESRTGQASQKGLPKREADRAEWRNWLTFTTTTGEVFSFRQVGIPGNVPERPK